MHSFSQHRRCLRRPSVVWTCPGSRCRRYRGQRAPPAGKARRPATARCIDPGHRRQASDIRRVCFAAVFYGNWVDVLVVLLASVRGTNVMRGEKRNVVIWREKWMIRRHVSVTRAHAALSGRSAVKRFIINCRFAIKFLIQVARRR